MEPVQRIQAAGIGWLLALLVLIVAVVMIVIGQLDLKYGGFIVALAAARLL